MTKCETGDMREGVEVPGKRKGDPKCLNFVMLPQEKKSILPYRSLLTFQILNSEKHKRGVLRTTAQAEILSRPNYWTQVSIGPQRFSSISIIRKQR